LKDKEYFVTNVRRHQSRLHGLPSLVVAESVDPAVGATWILQHLALNYEESTCLCLQEDGLFDILEEDGYGDGMCDVAGSQCVLEKPEDDFRYLSAEYGCCLVVPKAEVGAFGQDHVPPVTGSFEDPVTSKTIHFWTKPIAKLLEVSVST
jgi:hypothetical protein